MKALSLWQPWASLMADGRKKIVVRVTVERREAKRG